MNDRAHRLAVIRNPFRPQPEPNKEAAQLRERSRIR